MKKQILKLMLAMILVGVVAVALPKETAKAAAGAWVLTEEQVFVSNQYMNDTFMKETADENDWKLVDYRMLLSDPGTEYFKYFVSDGSDEVDTGRHVRNDSAYALRETYLGKSGNKVCFYEMSEGLDPIHDGAGYEASEVYTECTAPPKTIKPESKVELSLSARQENFINKGYGTGAAELMAKCYINNIYQMRNDKGDYWFQYGALAFENDLGNKFATTVSEKMPAAGKDGDTCFISFGAGPNEYRWIYTYSSTGSVSNDEKLGQVKNFKLKNTKGQRIYGSYSAVSGATGYQIKYSTKKNLKGASTFTVDNTQGTWVNKNKKAVAFEKGKTYYAKVRAYKTDASGKMIYGKWSKRASVKIKK